MGPKRKASVLEDKKNVKSISTKAKTVKGSSQRPLSTKAIVDEAAEGPSSSKVISTEDVSSITTNQELVDIVNSLVNTKQDEIFSQYKTSVKSQLESDHQLIASLQGDLHEKNKLIDELAAEVKLLKEERGNKSIDLSYQSSKEAIFESPIRKKTRNNESSLINSDQLSKELENIGFTLDMVELLTGLRIINYQEDESRYYFDVKQTSNSSPPVYINYRLIISKNIETAAEIHYAPTFMEALESDFQQDPDESMLQEDAVQNSRYLKKTLPDYLCENLSFPYGTLAQFYSKMSRALNRKK